MYNHNFIGREAELARLNKMFQSQQQEVALIYGRRRVGKSELIKQFIQEHEETAVYYECKQTTEMNNVQSLSLMIAEKLNLPPLGFANIEQLLAFLFQQACTRKLILVLDEYPYLPKTTAGLDSILQSLIDQYKGQSQMKLILCGSFVDTMKKILLQHNPLYGRISLVLNLKPMNYWESAQFYPSFSHEDKIRLYSVFAMR